MNVIKTAIEGVLIIEPRVFEDARGPYITFKDQPQEQRYYAVCWDTKHVKVQLPHYFDDTFKCPICHNEGAYDYEKKAPTYPPIMRF